MFNMQKEKTLMPTQNPEIRNSNFEEVNYGYDLTQAQNEANRCLNCKTKPCVSNCPVNVDIPSFINLIKEGKIDEAYEVITQNNRFPSICGRVCPQENQCEKKCVRAIKDESVAIGNLERFVGDNAKRKVDCITSNNRKVACIGSGPASLSFAVTMAKAGFEVHIFEALHENGGVLIYGIPEFRLPKAIVKKELEALKSLNVKFHNNVVIGKTITLDGLFEDNFETIFIGVGAGTPRFMNIPNEDAVGILSANEFLTRINLMKAYKVEYDTPINKAKHLVVVGGGNVAMDAARSAKRLGQDVTLMYRRDMKQLPARHEEIEHAIEEGINFMTLTNPVEVLVDDEYRVKGLKCQKMELVNDGNERLSFNPIVGSEFEVETDAVIMAIGSLSNTLFTNTVNNLNLDKRLNIVVDENFETNIPNVYAAGDIVTGAATVIQAMGHGLLAAQNAIERLKGSKDE